MRFCSKPSPKPLRKPKGHDFVIDRRHNKPARRGHEPDGAEMSDYKLYCFGESGNAYKPALMSACAGVEWTPVFVDFFNGETRSEAFRSDVNEMGKVPVLIHGERKLSQSGVILDYLAETTRKFGPRARMSAARFSAFFMQHIRQGNVYQYKSQADSALFFYNKAFTWSKQHTYFDSSFYVTDLLSGMGRCYRLVEQPQQSQIFLELIANAQNYKHNNAIGLIFRRFAALHQTIAEKNWAFNYPNYRNRNSRSLFFY